MPWSSAFSKTFEPEATTLSVLVVRETVEGCNPWLKGTKHLHDWKVMHRPCDGVYEYWPVPWKWFPYQKLLQLFVMCLHSLFSPWPNDQSQRQTCWGTQYSGWTPPLWRQYFEACVSVRHQLMSSSYSILAEASIGPLEVDVRQQACRDGLTLVSAVWSVTAYYSLQRDNATTSE